MDADICAPPPDFVQSVWRQRVMRVSDSVMSVAKPCACDTRCSMTRVRRTDGSVKAATTIGGANGFGVSSGVCLVRWSSTLRKTMSVNKPDDFIDDLVYAERYVLLDDPVSMAAKWAYSHGIVDSLILQLIQEPVQKHRTACKFSNGFPPPRMREGEILLGHDRDRQAVRMPLQFLNGHSITLGGSGSGKTIKSRWLVLQVAGHVRGLWLFDLRKREFASLKPLLARIGVDLIVVSARKMRLNPLQVPKGMAPTAWASTAADMLTRVLELPPRATKLIHTAMLRLFQSFRVLDGARTFPTLAELRAAIAADTTANAPARMAIIDSLDPVLMSLGSALDWRVGWTTADLATRHIVIEFGGTAEADKNLILNSLIISEFSRRVAAGISNAKMDLWICCDEAARLVSPNNASAMADLIGLVRGTGIGLDLSVQSANVASEIISNTSSKYIGRCGSATDYDVIGNAMGLTSEQRRSLPLTLTPGLFVGQVGEGSWRHPFIFRVPQLDDLIRDAIECQGSSGLDANHLELTGLGGLENLPTVPAEFQLALESTPFPKPAKPLAIVGNNSELDDVERRYLQCVIDQPGQPSSAYPRLAGTSARRAQLIRQRLIAGGFLREHAIQRSSRGRASILLEPLPTAFEVVKSSNQPNQVEAS